MKVVIIFLLSALALLNLAGAARLTPKKPNCNDNMVGCPRNYDPVCGVDGFTYPNECSLCSANRNRQQPVFIKKEGAC